jgi:3-oxoacyl-[acyl-carrier protein] reductase
MVEGSTNATGLQGKVVLVTGAAAGIGRATAIRFARERCRIVAWDVNEAVQEDLQRQICDQGGELIFRKTDVSNSKDVEDGVQEICSKWGRIDVLINNAGITRDSQLVKWAKGEPAGTMTDEAFDSVLSVNLRGVFHCARAVVPHMIRAGGGVIVNASSIVGIYGNFGQTNYAAAKAGVIAFTRTWSRELGKYNIRVNAIAPGFIATEMIRTIPDKVMQNMLAHTPLGRMGQPEDVAEAYVWLASDAASFITGAVLSVDGGLVLGT